MELAPRTRNFQIWEYQILIRGRGGQASKLRLDFVNLILRQIFKIFPSGVTKFLLCPCDFDELMFFIGSVAAETPNTYNLSDIVWLQNKTEVTYPTSNNSYSILSDALVSKLDIRIIAETRLKIWCRSSKILMPTFWNWGHNFKILALY